MIIKKYNQFVKTKFNESVDLSEDNINQEIENVTEEEESEEEGSEYIGQKMIKDLADRLGVKPNADGSITYKGKKINFFSETEKFHVDNKKFSSIDEVINYLNGDVETTVKPENKFESKSYKFTRKFKIQNSIN